MSKATREDIHLVNRYSNLTEKSVDDLLKENVYHNSADWKKFLRLFFVSLGTGFIIAGIIFFFAYNWADLNKFIKLGLIESLIIILSLALLSSKIKLLYKNVMLTAASLLTGVLFAVFGQIYQTGASAYDFFLGWTLCITLWVLISDFAVLWLIYIILLNTTLLFYEDQVARNWPDEKLFTLLFLMNCIFFAALGAYSKLKNSSIVPKWLLYTVALIATTFATVGMTAIISEGISYSEYHPFTYWSPVFLALVLAAFAIAVIYGLKQKSIFYPATITLSIIIIISALFIESTKSEGMLLFLCLFILGSVTAAIKLFISLKKKWENE